MGVLRLETENLLIRSFTPGDVPAVHAYMSDPAVGEYFLDRPFDEARTREFVEPGDGTDATALAMVLLTDGRLIGHLDFHPWFGAAHEIGWTVAPAHQGQGYATEGALALLRHGFETLRLHRVVATCQPENVASCRVMRKLGLRQEGHFRQCIERPDGTWWDELFFAMLAEEWTGVSLE